MRSVVVLFLVVCFTRSKVLYNEYKVLETEPLMQRKEVVIVKELLDWETREVLMFDDSLSVGGVATLLVSPDAVSSVMEALNFHHIAFTLKNDNYQRTLDMHARQNEDALLRLNKLNSLKMAKFDHTAYLTYEEQCNFLYEKSSQSEIAMIYDIGTTFEGRSILALRTNYLDAYNDNGMPTVWLDANMRGCDWITSATALYIIDQILFGDSTDAIYLRDNFHFVIIPNANPDGYEYSHIDRFWVKNRSVISGVNSTNTTCVGVSLNRNWDINFKEYGSSEDPCADDYRGPDAMSELETLRMSELVQSIKPSLKLFMSMHAFSQKWLLPFGSSSDMPPDYDELMRVANASVNQMEFVNYGDVSRKFSIGTVFSFDGIVPGAAFDWVKSEYNIPYTYLVKLRPLTAGDGGVDLPPDQIIKSGQEMLAGLAECCRQAYISQQFGKK